MQDALFGYGPNMPSEMLKDTKRMTLSLLKGAKRGFCADHYLCQ